MGNKNGKARNIFSVVSSFCLSHSQGAHQAVYELLHRIGRHDRAVVILQLVSDALLSGIAGRH